LSRARLFSLDEAVHVSALQGTLAFLLTI
jgi:hypothetical protein